MTDDAFVPAWDLKRLPPGPRVIAAVGVVGEDQGLVSKRWRPGLQRHTHRWRSAPDCGLSSDAACQVELFVVCGFTREARPL